MLRGVEAEERAARYLQAQGLKLLARNWRCRFGEIDLILRDGATLVFAEVRARGRSDYGGAAESITAAKRGRLQRSAAAYLAQCEHRGACRFDAVLIDGDRLTWLRGAFDAGG
jgi:putative endonuclease